MQVVLDANVLLGLMDKHDIWHTRAVAVYTGIKAAGATEVVFDCALAEAISVAGRRLHEKRRVADWDTMIQQFLADYVPARLTWIFSDVQELFNDIMALMRSTQGELNFNDALMAVSCRERGFPVIASFDPDFDQVSWLTRITKPDDLTSEK